MNTSWRENWQGKVSIYPLQFSVAAATQDCACRPLFLGMLFQRLCQKRLLKGKFYFSEIPYSNTNFVNHFLKPASRNLACVC